MKSKLIALIALTLISQPVLAKCYKSNVCDDYGQNCEAIDICSNVLDLPSTNLTPLAPFPTLKFKPMPSMKLPPLGTSSCEYMQVNGQWQNICR
jgi:hypothetical protein